MLTAMDIRYRTALDYQAFAANDMEYDHLPDSWEQVENAMRERPAIVSLDRLYAIYACPEFVMRRGADVVTPFSKIFASSREEMRCDLFDEHRVIRCKHCGSETEAEGTFVFQNGEPRVRVRCQTPHTEKCYSLQSALCSEKWGWVGPTNLTDKLVNQIREAHGQYEGMFDSLRKRYGLAGKDTSGKVKRRSVVTAQQLRAEAALLIEWLRLSLRHGWIGSWANRNTNAPRAVDEKGRTERILASRRKRALRFPYGKMAVRLGLCKPPPDDDPAPVAPAPAS
jgi:hypothetical protein